MIVDLRLLEWAIDKSMYQIEALRLEDRCYDLSVRNTSIVSSLCLMDFVLVYV